MGGGELAALVARLPRAEDGVDVISEHVCKRCGHVETMTIRLRNAFVPMSQLTQQLIDKARCPKCQRRNWSAYRPKLGLLLSMLLVAPFVFVAPWYVVVPWALTSGVIVFDTVRRFAQVDAGVFVLPEPRTVPRLGPYGR